MRIAIFVLQSTVIALLLLQYHFLTLPLLSSSSMDFWSSANFFIEMVETNIDHHKKRKRLCFIENVWKEFESYAATK